VAVKYDDRSDTLVLADYKIWKPTPGQLINLEASVEFFLRRIYTVESLRRRECRRLVSRANGVYKPKNANKGDNVFHAHQSNHVGWIMWKPGEPTPERKLSAACT